MGDLSHTGHTGMAKQLGSGQGEAGEAGDARHEWP
jgi:hypothetical protein